MEMVSAKAIQFHNKNTFELMKTDEREHPVSLQLFGTDPDVLSEATKRIEECSFDILDINMGCPVRRQSLCMGERGNSIIREKQTGILSVR